MVNVGYQFFIHVIGEQAAPQRIAQRTALRLQCLSSGLQQHLPLQLGVVLEQLGHTFHKVSLILAIVLTQPAPHFIWQQPFAVQMFQLPQTGLGSEQLPQAFLARNPVRWLFRQPQSVQQELDRRSLT